MILNFKSLAEYRKLEEITTKNIIEKWRVYKLEKKTIGKIQFIKKTLNINIMFLKYQYLERNEE